MAEQPDKFQWDALCESVDRIADQLEQIKCFLALEREERANAFARQRDGVPANVRYLSSKWPRRDGDKYRENPSPPKNAG